MKLSTKGRYGARLMMDLALHYGNGPIALKDIAERQEISEKYLWQLIVPLKIAGLINATRGPQGGYALSKKPSEITLKDIINILDGPLCIVDCVDKPEICKRSESCVTRNIWAEVTDKISEILGSITLEDMIKKQGK
ncbi:MAG: RrF2 family transcriptional regulator [bacterium]